ncbi:MAG: hypothetical protein V7K37_03075 [Nostoc sp.]
MLATPAIAANVPGDLLKQPATEITVSLGNSANELKSLILDKTVLTPIVHREK